MRDSKHSCRETVIRNHAIHHRHGKPDKRQK